MRVCACARVHRGFVRARDSTHPHPLTHCCYARCTPRCRFTRVPWVCARARAAQAYSESTFLTAYIIAMLWAALFVTLVSSATWCSATRKPQAAPVLRTLRLVTRLSTTVLFLPVTSVLMRGLACPSADQWMGTDMSCWQGGHLVLALVQAVLLLVYVALSLFAASILINRDVRRPTLDSKVNARIDVAMLAVKTVLAAVYNLPANGATASWVVVLLVLASGGVWLTLAQLHRPFLTPTMNDLQSGALQCRARSLAWCLAHGALQASPLGTCGRARCCSSRSWAWRPTTSAWRCWAASCWPWWRARRSATLASSARRRGR